MTVLTAEQKHNIANAIRRGLDTLRCPAPMRLSEWAEQYFYLSAESSYVEGRWECYPYQIAIMDCMGHDDIREVWFQKSARVGYTKMLLACIGYMAHHKKRNQVVWQPVDDDADEFVKTEIDPMLRDMPALRKIFPWYNAKHKGNTLRLKAFLGSSLHIRGGKAGKNYRRLSADAAYLDEIDGFDRDIESEGDPVTLASKRIEGAVFPKLICGSTPKLKGLSMVESGAEAAELQMRYNVPCPFCHEEHELLWRGVKFDKNALDDVRYECPHCECRYTQNQFFEVWDKGRWIDAEGAVYIDSECRFLSVANDEPVPIPVSISFFIWTIYSPQQTWTRIVQDFLAAKRDPAKLKTFVNTTLGETWEEEGTQPPVNTILDRREDYPAEVPQDAVVLTAGADVQKDRVEIYVVGWGDGEEAWFVDTLPIYGDPGSAELWKEVDKALSATYQHESGARLGISAAAIDSGGHHTQFVYDYCRTRSARRIVPIKGIGGEGKELLGRPNRKQTGKQKRKVDLYPVGVDAAKALIYSRLQITEHGPGYIHVPAGHSLFADEFAEQLTAEKLITRYRRGFAHQEWQQMRARNEALDCAVYALAALRLLNPNYHQLQSNVVNASVEEQTVEPVPQQVIKRRRSTYL